MKSSKYHCLFLKRRLRAAALKAIIWLIYHFSLFHLQMPSRWSGIPKIIPLTTASSVVNVTYVADAVFLYLFERTEMSKELYWRSKWLCDKWGHAYVQGLGRGESVDLKKWGIRIIFPYFDEIKKKKKIFPGVINCFTRIRENKIIYIPGGQ